MLNSISLATQRKLGVSRRSVGPFRELYKGIIWMSFPFEAGRRIIHDDISKVFLKSARTTYLPEEIYLQTFFLNSDLRSLVVNEDLRFTDWSPRNGIVPAYLDETDAVLILNSKALFARKMSSVLSSRLLDKIDTALVAKR